MVEAVTAAMFLLLGVVECLGQGANLPVRPAEPFAACGIYAYHLLLLCTLLAAVLIEADGHRLPLRVFLPAVVVGWLAPALWPRLHPVPASYALLDGWAGGLLDGALGLAAGALLGWLASRFCRIEQRPGMIVGPACVGLFLGWQAIVVLMALTVAVHLLLLAVGRLLPRASRLPANAWLALATLGWILSWSRWLDLAHFAG